jgi:hypothetical protein
MGFTRDSEISLKLDSKNNSRALLLNKLTLFKRDVSPWFHCLLRKFMALFMQEEIWGSHMSEYVDCDLLGYDHM